MNFRTWLEEKATINGNAPYIYHENKIISYKETDLMANKAANLFKNLGVTKGDKCTIILNNSPDYLFIWFGLAKIGAVAACLNRFLKGEGLRHLINCSDSTVVVIDAELKDAYEAIESGLSKVKHVIWYPDVPEGRKSKDCSFTKLFQLALDDKPPITDIKKGDPMAFLHTGGTTGLPKWCILSHNCYIALGKKIADFFCLTSRDRVLNPLPLFHLNPQGFYVMGALAGNASIVMIDRFSASAFWDQVQGYAVTVLILHVGIVDILKARPFHEKENSHSVRLGYRVDAEFMERFNIPEGIVGYGSTEAAGLTHMNRYRMPLTVEEKKLSRLSSSCGQPRSDIEIMIANDDDEAVPVNEMGEILVRPREPYVMFDGYYSSPEKTVEAFRNLWYHSGDIGFLDEKGGLHFVQRKGDSIRVRGEWVFVSEVEDVIRLHPNVEDCAVVGVMGDVGGEEIKAVIEPKPGKTISELEIIVHCEDKLAYFMLPRYIEVIDELPRTDAAGRIQKAELKKSGIARAWDRDATGYKIKK